MKKIVQQVVAQLKSIDAEVRAHEQAHIAAAGSGVSASAASFEYEKGVINRNRIMNTINTIQSHSPPPHPYPYIIILLS